MFRAAPVLKCFTRASAARPTTFLRLASTASTQRQEPEVVAASLLDSITGKSMAEKSSVFLLTASIAAFLVSKEIYIVDGEFFEVEPDHGSNASGGKDAAAAYFAEKQSTINRVLSEARGNHKAVVQERMDHIGKLKNVVAATEALYEVSKSTAHLEAQAFELKQRVEFQAQVKSTLDSWVRQEAAQREQEQSRLVESVMAGVAGKLSDPKTQQSILMQSIAALEKMRLAK